MPIEIKELIIKAEVGQGQQAARNTSGISPEERRQLVQDCVEQVLEIIKKEKER